MKHTDSLSSASLVKCTVFVPCFSNSSPFLGLPTISNRQQSFKKFPGRAGEGGSRVISEFWPMNVLASSVHVFPITLLLSPFPPPIPHTHTQEESNERDRERLRPRERQRDTERERQRKRHGECESRSTKSTILSQIYYCDVLLGLLC